MCRYEYCCLCSVADAIHERAAPQRKTPIVLCRYFGSGSPCVISILSERQVGTDVPLRLLLLMVVNAIHSSTAAQDLLEFCAVYFQLATLAAVGLA